MILSRRSLSTQCQFRCLADGDVGRRPDDAPRLAGRIALDDLAAVVDPDHVALPVTRAELDVEHRRQSAQMQIHRGLVARVILARQDAFAEAAVHILPRDVRRRIAEHPAQLVAADDLAGGHVPVPQSLVAAAQREFEALGIALSLRVARTAFGDVDVRADQPRRFPAHVAFDDHAAAEDPDEVAVGVPHAVRALVVRRAALEVRLHRRVEHGPVVAMDQRPPVERVAGEVDARVAEHQLLARVDGPATGRDVEVPQPHLPAAQHQFEQLHAALLLEPRFHGHRLVVAREPLGGDRLLAQVEQQRRLAGQRGQALPLRVGQRARLPVDHAQRTDRVAVRHHDRRAGVEADVRFAGDEGVVDEARIGGGVLDREQAFGVPGIACAQNATLRALSFRSVPTAALYHCRSRSISARIAIGVPHTCDARTVRSS